MTTITIETGSIANVSAALVSIGFTADSNDNTKLYWTNDTNHKIYIKLLTSGSNTQISVYNSSNAAVSNITVIALNASSAWKLTYEVIGNSIVFGFRLLNDSYSTLQYAIVEPANENEEWIYCYPQAGYAVGGNSQTVMQICSYQLYTGSTSGVQIVKAYYGGKFMSNLYITSYSPSINSVNGSSSGGNNYATATIEGNEYIIVNLHQNVNYAKFAIRRAA